MIESSSESRSEFENLPDHTLVYRGLRKGWIDRDRSIVKLDAYYLRQRIKEEGISVNFSIEQSLSALKNCAGVASLNVGEIRELGLNVVRDSSSHGSIMGLPIGVNLTSNPFRDYCLTIKARSPLTPLKKGGTGVFSKSPFLRGI
ncbi:hypothetical protein CP500_012480 [Tychonema bourrellyi FEM_GT703]|uniref:Uncharacterized protein n=1 Tax=Tychonema bourrellyi FEM_GT703 TaxID=2040638 RepID=A0A2G4F031_9CYAN|nr:hypothetical protein CP500_012480 [Tychonema bourrellyi FEM_GT703]